MFKQRWSKVVQLWKTVLLRLFDVVLTLFHCRTTPLYQGCTMLKVRRQILFHFQRRIRVISTLIHKVQARFIIVFDWDWASTTFLYTSQLLQIPCTSSPPTNHLYNTYSRRHIWNQAKHVQRGHFCKYSQPVKTVGYFRREAPSWIRDRILNTTLPNNLFPLIHPWFTPTQDPSFLE